MLESVLGHDLLSHFSQQTTTLGTFNALEADISLILCTSDRKLMIHLYKLFGRRIDHLEWDWLYENRIEFFNGYLNWLRKPYGAGCFADHLRKLWALVKVLQLVSKVMQREMALVWLVMSLGHRVWRSRFLIWTAGWCQTVCLRW